MYKGTFAIAAAALATGAQAQNFFTGFEAPTYSASGAGVPLTVGINNPAGGQDSWYLPAGIASNVHTYAGNAPGFVQNPTGGDQFVSGISGGGTNFARAQRNFAFDAGQFTIAWDMAAMFLATGASAINLSSMSLQHDTVPAGQFRQFIALNNFVDLANPAAGWKAEFNVFNAAGGALNNQSPGTTWAALQVNHWYRQSVTFDLATNQIVSISLEDLHSGVVTATSPVGWYMTGGAASTLALPNAYRMFVGGAAGNAMGWDNVSVVPAPATLALMGLGALAAARRRRA
ncbi:MAG: PEP-CTERM sorting domain-containing protein [Phycisphaerae bacterium]|nr:PEP-CTERM sorting domain-containing protein [Phycisphaerae bacterium]